MKSCGESMYETLSKFFSFCLHLSRSLSEFCVGPLQLPHSRREVPVLRTALGSGDLRRHVVFLSTRVILVVFHDFFLLLLCEGTLCVSGGVWRGEGVSERNRSFSADFFLVSCRERGQGCVGVVVSD